MKSSWLVQERPPGVSSPAYRQLLRRCGRQGDPGSSEAILSLEDELLTHDCPTLIRRRLSQRAEEQRHVRMRRTLMEVEEYLSELLSFSSCGLMST